MNKVNLIIVGLLAVVAISLISCKGKRSNIVCENLKDKKVLVVYFSRAGENYIVGKVDKGNTAFIAEYIAEMTGADLYEVKGEKDYESKSYKEMLDLVREEGENQEFPGFKTSLGDVSDYDVIFIGGPIWWGTYPRAMHTFFKSYDLNGKTIIPFTTNEGSGLGNTITDLKKYYPDANIIDGFSMPGHEAREPGAREIVKHWLENLKLTDNIAQNIDGISGATIMKSPLTDEGRKLEQDIVENVQVTYDDGTTESIPLVISGAVDMGNGIVWSANNIGASKPWETGDHFSWGEAEAKDSFTESNYEYEGKTLGKDISGTWYDTARRFYGGDWRMPTYDEWNKLLHGTTPEHVTIHNVPGYLFTAQNGNSIFLPGNGYIYDKTVGTPEEGYYWSSTNANPVNAYVTYLPANSWGQSNYGKSVGLGIRAVRDGDKAEL